MGSRSSSSDDSAQKQSLVVQEKEIEHGEPQLLGTQDLHAAIVPHVKNWPTNPLPTRYTTQIEIMLTFYDLILVLIPCLMIAKAIACVVAAKKDLDAGHVGIYIEYASNLSKRLVMANAQMATLFTIFFLVIMGTFFKRMALWKAQKGAKLSELELLQASVSPTSTFRMIGVLRIFTALSFAVASVWVWYYVGSQAMVYEFTLKDSFDPQPYPVAVLGPDALSPFEDGTWPQYTTVQKTDSNSLFHVYAQKVKGSHSGIIYSDIIANALPILYAEGADFPARSKDGDGWVEVPSTANYDIISAIGTNFYINEELEPSDAGYDHGWHAMRVLGEMTFNATYLWVKCGNLALTTAKAPAGLLPSMTMSMNMTNTTLPGEQRTFDLWNMYNASHAFEATCGIQQLNQEVTVKCDPKACKVSQIRSRPGFANPSNTSRLFSNDANALAFMNSLLYACGKPVNTSDVSTFEADNGLPLYKAGLDSGTFTASDFPGNANPDIASVQNQAQVSLGFAMTKYFNTYQAAAKHLKYEHGFDAQELTSDSRNITLHASDSGWIVSKMYGAEYEPNYAISWPWIVVDIVASTVLLAAAIGAMIIRQKTEAPDIFGYVSSLTRDNDLLDVPGGSALGGVDRTRMMKHVQVKLGEVPAGDGQSRIAFTYVGTDDHCARTLQKGKLYV